jgi:hypothetical protein
MLQKGIDLGGVLRILLPVRVTHSTISFLLKTSFCTPILLRRAFGLCQDVSLVANERI